MARVIRCALVQIGSDLPMDRPVDEIKAALNDKCARLIETAAARGVRVLALPELFNTPYFATATDPRWYAAAEPIPGGPTTALMRELARRHEMVIVAPFYEQAGAARYNSAAVIDADGRFLGVYRKHHVPSPHAGNYEPFYFHRPDVGFPVFETAYGRIGDLHLLRPALPGDRSRLRGQGRRDRLQPLGDRGAPVGAGVGARAAGARAGQRLLRRRPEPGRTGPAVRQRGVLRQELLLQPARRDRRPGGAGRRGGPDCRPRPRRDPVEPRELAHEPAVPRPEAGHVPRDARRGHPGLPRHGKESHPWLTRSEASTTFRS